MHYSVRADLIEQIAQRMNPGKYTWSESNKEDLRGAAAGLLTFIEGYQRAAELQEKVSSSNKTILNNYPNAVTANQTDLQGVPAQTGTDKLKPVPYYPPGIRGFVLADPNRPAPTPLQEFRPRPDRPYNTRVNMSTGYSVGHDHAEDEGPQVAAIVHRKGTVGSIGAQRDSVADPITDR